MCQIVKTPEGQEIVSVGELKARWLVLVKDPAYKQLGPDSACLCGVDIATSAWHSGIKVMKLESGDWLELLPPPAEEPPPAQQEAA